MAANQQLIARRKAVTPRGIPLADHVAIRSADGATFVDEAGKEWIDFAGGIGVMNVGHCNPAVVEAIRHQAGMLLHGGLHISTYEPFVTLCEKLVERFPHGGPTKVMLVNTGAESVENAIKIARQATKRPGIVCFSDSFHGRSMMAMSLTSKVAYKHGCGPFAPEIYRLPFPNHFRFGRGLSEAAFAAQELQRFRDAMITMVSADQVAAVILEPIQGEGGFVPVPAAYLKGLRAICDEFGILLILDEVQSGFGRTGRWASYEHYDVVPDLSTWAKSMGGGLPIGCVIGKASVMDAALPGTIGGTYGGNPVACAASLAAMEEIERLQLCRRAETIGAKVQTAFQGLQAKYPDWIGDVRGIGAMMAMEFVENSDPLRPVTGIVAEIVSQCVQGGLLILSAGVYGNVVRFLAPLVITDDQLTRGLEILSTAVTHAIEGQAVATA